MVAEVSYKMVMNVIDSWERVKRTTNYEEVMGELIFSKLVDLDPKVRKIFGFKDGEDIRENPCYAMHARATVERLDMAVCLLGPDLEPLEEDLWELGDRHLSYGVQPKNLPFMAKSLIGAIEKVLKGELSAEEEKGWYAVLEFMIESMTLGMKATN